MFVNITGTLFEDILIIEMIWIFTFFWNKQLEDTEGYVRLWFKLIY